MAVPDAGPGGGARARRTTPRGSTPSSPDGPSAAPAGRCGSGASSPPGRRTRRRRRRACSRTRSSARPEARRDLARSSCSHWVEMYRSTPAVLGRARPGPTRGRGRLVLHADLVGALDRRPRPTRARVAVADHQVAEDVAVGVDRRAPSASAASGSTSGVERLVLDGDGGDRPAGRLGVVGRHGGHRLAHVAHDVVGEHRLVGVLEPVHLAAGDVVGGDDGLHAGDPQRRRRCRSTRSGRGGGATQRARPTACPRPTGRTRRRSGPGPWACRRAAAPTRRAGAPVRASARVGGAASTCWSRVTSAIRGAPRPTACTAARIRP